MIETIRLNLRIIKTINGCNREDFKALLDEVVGMPGIFTSRKYVWNIIRPRDFYKCVSYWIIKQCNVAVRESNPDQRAELVDIIDTTIRTVLATTPDFKIRQSFVWSITKQFPILTLDIIQYASDIKIRNIAKNDKDILYTKPLTPFIEEIEDLKAEVAMLKVSNEM